MCKGRSDDDFVDGDDERGSGNSCWSLLAFYGDTLVQGWHVCIQCMYPLDFGPYVTVRIIVPTVEVKSF